MSLFKKILSKIFPDSNSLAEKNENFNPEPEIYNPPEIPEIPKYDKTYDEIIAMDNVILGNIEMLKMYLEDSDLKREKIEVYSSDLGDVLEVDFDNGEKVVVLVSVLCSKRKDDCTYGTEMSDAIKRNGLKIIDIQIIQKSETDYTINFIFEDERLLLPVT